MKMIRKGEYDLVNISLIGFDPVTGRSYEECQKEWNAERDRVLSEWNTLSWWKFWRNIELRWQFTVLIGRRGF